MNVLTHVLFTAMLAYAAPTDPSAWRSVLATFTNDQMFRAALAAHGDDPRARELRRHLEVTGLRYASMGELMQHLAAELRERPDAPLVREHLAWLGLVLDQLRAEYGRTPTLARARRELTRLLNRTRAVAGGEDAFVNLIRARIGTHALERQVLEEQTGVAIDDPRFAARAFDRAARGDLSESLKRLEIGEYLTLRSIFSPTVRQAQVASSRLAHSGDLGREVRLARRYQNPRNFIRNGWSADDDMLRIAMGTLQERVYERGESRDDRLVTRPEIVREVLMAIDVTSSMWTDGRGRLRNLITASYLDQIFTRSLAAGEKVAVHLIPYGPKVGKITTVETLAEARQAFNALADDETSDAGLARHARAITSGIAQVIARNRPLTHLNVVLVTDGEEAVDVGSVKQYLDQLKVGPEGLRLSFAAISLVKGDASLEHMTKDVSRVDARFASANPSHQFFDAESMARWTDPGWADVYLGQDFSRVWRAEPNDLQPLGTALRAIDLSERPVAPGVIEGEGGSGAHTGETEHGTEDAANPTERASSTWPEGHLPVDSLDTNETLGNQADVAPDKNLVVYRLRTRHGPGPELLLQATTDNVPSTLARGLAHARAARDLFAVHLVDEARPTDLVVERLTPTVGSGGLAPLARPVGFSLARVRLRDESARELKGYEVFQIARNGLYLVRFGQGRTPRTFTYEAEYVRDPNLGTRAAIFDRLDRRALAAVATLLNEDRLGAAGRAVRGRSTRRFGLRAEHVASALATSADYTFAPANGPALTTGRFAKYQVFLKNDRLHYQCSGAARLLKDVFTTYAEAAREPYLHAEVVGGYAISGPEARISDAHAVTALSDARVQFAPLFLDATPGGRDVAAATHLLKYVWRKTRAATTGALDHVTAGVRARYLPKTKSGCQDDLD